MWVCVHDEFDNSGTEYETIPQCEEMMRQRREHLIADHIFEDADERFRVLLEGKALSHMFGLCRASRSQETGGILIGSYVDEDQTAHVVEATGPPSDSRSGATWFHRGTRGLTKLLARRWEDPRRTYYVGEWHFHPAHAPSASPQDERQMHEIALSPNYHCTRPLLIIIYLVGQDLCASCFVSVEGESPQLIPLSSREHA